MDPRAAGAEVDVLAAKAAVAYLTGAEGAAQWASVGCDLSRNKLAIGSYTDARLIKKAEPLAGAVKG